MHITGKKVRRNSVLVVLLILSLSLSFEQTALADAPIRVLSTATRNNFPAELFFDIEAASEASDIVSIQLSFRMRGQGSETIAPPTVIPFAPIPSRRRPAWSPLGLRNTDPAERPLGCFLRLWTRSRVRRSTDFGSPSSKSIVTERINAGVSRNRECRYLKPASSRFQRSMVPEA